MKKSFVLFYDLDESIKMLTDEEAGALLKAVYDYEIRQKKASFEDRMLQSTFLRIADSLDRNRIKYEESRVKKKEAAALRLEKINSLAK